MRIVALTAAILIGCLSSFVSAEQISRASLLQYQYSIDVPACNVQLKDGTRVEFSGVFANENGEVVFHSLAVIAIRTQAAFQFSSIVTVSGNGEKYSAKVVKTDGGRVYFALDASFLNVLWGSEDPFTIGNLGHPPYDKELYFGLADDAGGARLALSKGRTCQFDAQNVD